MLPQSGLHSCADSTIKQHWQAHHHRAANVSKGIAYLSRVVGCALCWHTAQHMPTTWSDNAAATQTSPAGAGVMAALSHGPGTALFDAHKEDQVQHTVASLTKGLHNHAALLDGLRS